jgi:hypothetical protein
MKINPQTGSGMNIPDLVFANLVSDFGLKILEFFDADPDQGSGILSTLDPGSEINIPDSQHCKFALSGSTGRSAVIPYNFL